MRKLVYGIFVSLDGYIAGPDDDLSWHVVDEELHRFANEQEKKTAVLIYGRKMYEAMSYWQTADANPNSPDYEIEYARIWQSKPIVVFSRTLKEVSGNALLASEDLASTVARLKEQGEGVIGIGGAGIAAQAIRLGLVDEYEIYIHPALAGSGTPAFEHSDHIRSLRLLESKTFRSGVVYLHYQNTNGAGG